MSAKAFPAPDTEQEEKINTIFNELPYLINVYPNDTRRIGIINYPFWQMTEKNPRAVFACINYGEAYVPEEIAERSICINADIEKILNNYRTAGLILSLGK